MADLSFIPQGLFPVTGAAPETTNGGKTADYISLKNTQMCYVVIHLKQAVGHATAFTVERATDVAATGSVAIANVVPIYYGNVSATSTQLARQTDAVSFTADVGVTGNVIIIFVIDPTNLGSTYDCITVKSANSGQATNIWEVMYWVEPRYESKVASMSANEFIVD